MLKVKLFIASIFIFLSPVIGQGYKLLTEDYKCGKTNRYTIYATNDDVVLLKDFLKHCDDLEYLRITGYKPGGHWDDLFNILSDKLYSAEISLVRLVSGFVVNIALKAPL